MPRGMGIWFLFLLLVLVSVIGIDSPGRLVGFVYRALDYLSVTVVFVYVYNARASLTPQYLLGLVTLFWVWTVVGGYASVFFPTFSFRTPLGLLLPGSLRNNEVVGEMVVRRLTQYNPDSWIVLEPRPSAPFLYTNQWGNVYSLCLPMVIAYMSLIRRGALFWTLCATIVASLIPALLTLNRGMFIGIGIASVYVFWRCALSGRWRIVGGLTASGVVVAIVAQAVGVVDRLAFRVESSSSTEDRADLYGETLRRSLESPLFGYGGPRPSMIEGAPSAGTQGHLWAVMFSHGFPALLCFIAALLWLFLSTYRAKGLEGLLLHTVCLVILVEMLYYGVLPNGLILAFVAAALALREREYVILPDVNSTRYAST
ncbi:MAG: O-antigen ligase family protein [Galactobacter sp.]|uniref:O-antigen ligase family protein n=1 Tax=Galactobacter sp. TaxID=2676125 RepID=UPI0025BAF9F8|nr:O-antigen ligase family protein [Galactobacter sp.]